MRKILLWLVLGALGFAEQLEVYAYKVDTNTTHIAASGDVMVLYKDQYLSANRILYDRNSTVLELFGNIMVLKADSYHGIGEYAKLNLTKQERELKPFYLIEKSRQVWMSTAEACEAENSIDLKKGMVSGCDPTDPLWRIYFSSSDYDTKTKWMNIYNARLYFYDVPIFYLPYFGYSLDTRRRTGLLVPSFGLSSEEGFYYRQPIYITDSDRWDIELRPQFRTLRGSGLYGRLRFVDSPLSKGELRMGIFKEKESYAREYDLANNEHYGVELRYENHAILPEWFDVGKNGQSGLFSDITWMNDIDYLNLSNNDETKNATTNQLFSRINAFYNAEREYVGTYFKYFTDLSRKNSDGTIQTLPNVHYHHYLKPILGDHFLYSADLNINNFYRKAGVNAFQSDLNIPLTLRTSIFDDWLELNYRMQLYGRYISFSGEEAKPDPYHRYETGYFAQNYHTAYAETSFVRAYENFSHLMNINASYTKGGFDTQDGYYADTEDVCNRSFISSNPLCDYYTIENIAEATRFRFSQFFFDGDGNQVLYHKLSQDITLGSNETLGELENELELALDNYFSLYNDTLYNYDRGRVTKFLNSLRYGRESIEWNLTYLYEDILRDTNPEYSSYVTADIEYRQNRHYRYFATYAYDFHERVTKRLEAGFLYSKRCWDFGIRYVENNRPSLTNNLSSSVYDKYIYFTIRLKPVGGSDVNYKISNILEGS